MFKYKLPRLIDYDGDLTKQWYIIYYIWNRDKHILERKRNFSINYNTIPLRREAAKKAIQEITQLLQSGGTSYTEKPKVNTLGLDPDKATLFQAYEHALEIKKGSMKNMKGLISLKNHIKEWLTASRYEHLLFKGIDTETIHKFFDWLKTEKKMGNKTYNNNKGYLSTIFNFYVSRGWIEKNPCDKVKKLKTQSGKHVPFSKEQIKTIKKELGKSKQDQLALFIQCIYYTFIRPGELRELKIDNIKEKTIFVPANISKNGKGEHVVIPKPLEKLLKPIRKNPANFYIFGNEGLPGENKVSVNYFYKRHVKLLESISLNYDDYTLYGYKHTGNIALFNAGADIKTLQKQNRHSSIQQTDTYLKDLGLIRNEELKLFPEF
jgi:integrase